jgi:hypothetical protein
MGVRQPVFERYVMKTYMQTIQIEFTVTDDADARKIFELNVVKNPAPYGDVVVKERLQEIFPNKPPRKVEI